MHIRGFMQMRKRLTNAHAGFVFFLLILLIPGSLIAKDWVYTVALGDNLWDFSEKHLDNVMRFEQLRKINNIKNPKKLKPGSKIRVPLKWIRSNPVPAEIVAIEGSARLYRVNGEVEAVNKAGALVQLGDRLKTGTDSTVAIRFADDSILTLHADSYIRFDHLSAHGETGMVDSRLNLLEGRLDTRVTPAAGPGSRFEIHTPSAISAVRGTEYRATAANNSQSSSIEVLHGKVAVKGASKQRLVKSGFGTRIEAGKAPIAPRKLLEPPRINPIPERIRTLNWTLSWETLKGATGYRIEISDRQDFNTIVWQKKTEYPKAGLPDLLDGQYFVRVRGIDQVGLEGRQQAVAIVMDTRPQPPVQLKPSSGQVFRGESPRLQWTDSAEADHYKLEIASDSHFEQLLLSRDDVKITRFDSSAISQVGKYYWRLTSIADDGEFGPAGSARSYEIKPVPEKITANMDVAEDGKLMATWHAGSTGQSYQVQIASEPDFDDLLLDETVSKAQIRFEPAKGQVRYLRVRGIEPDGYQGPWGAAQRIDPEPDKSFWAIPVLGILGILLL